MVLRGGILVTRPFFSAGWIRQIRIEGRGKRMKGKKMILTAAEPGLGERLRTDLAGQERIYAAAYERAGRLRVAIEELNVAEAKGLEVLENV